MKIVHTSDWHLGQELYSYDRMEEHQAFLTQLKEIVADEQPDALVVCGDIYHNATPSNAVMRMFSDYMLEVSEVCRHMKIIVIAGNHDSSARLEVTRNLWQRVNVEVLGKVEKNDGEVDFNRHIITVNDKDGNAVGVVVAMPHIYPQAMPLVSEDTPREERQKAFWNALNEAVKQHNTVNVPVVMMAHMAISGSETTGHDLCRGGMDYIDINDIPVNYDYLALGHIHYAQNVDGSRARYCGSPIPVSFDEDYEHSVTIVELNKGSEPMIRTIAIANPIPMKTIPSQAALENESLAELKKLNNQEKAYIRLNVKREGLMSTRLREEAFNIVNGTELRFCTIKWEQPETTEGVVKSKKYALEDIQQISSIDVAKQHYLNKMGSDMPNELLELLEQVVREVNTKES